MFLAFDEHVVGLNGFAGTELMGKPGFWTVAIAVAASILYFQNLPGIPPLWPGMLTFHFSHASPEHLFQNVVALLIFGHIIESKEGWRIVLVLFTSSFAGGLASMVAGGGRGLSAGVFGLMGYVMSRHPGADVIGIPAGALAFSYALYNLLFQEPGVSAIAHAAGFMAGMAMARKGDGFTYFVAAINIVAAILWMARFGP